MYDDTEHCSLNSLDTATFVDEIFVALKSRSYISRATDKASIKLEQPTLAPQPVPIQSIVGTSTSEYLPHPSRALNNPPPNAPTGPAATRGLVAQHRLPDRPTGASLAPYAQHDQSHSSRKRKLKERDTIQSHDGHDTYSSRNTGSDRPSKQTARWGGRNGNSGGIVAQNGSSGSTAMPAAFSGFLPFSEVPPFDPTNPVALFAMAAAFGLNLPNMPGPNAQGEDSSNASCSDYDTKGYCAAGSICPYQHGGAIAVPADKLSEYDSKFVSITGQGNDKRHGGGRARASFSNPGPSRDRTNTTLVIEQIPQENFTEESVRKFFSSFGAIVDVQMQTYKRLAVIKYDTHDAAKRAYNSPKPIFDNRFVKVYWYKSGSEYGSFRTTQGEVDVDDPNYGTEEVLDPEEIRKRQAEAQKVFEDRQRKAEEAAAKAEEIEKRLQETNDQILKLRRELAARSRNGTNGVGEGGDDDLDEDFSRDLATLQAEAEDLFAQRDTHAWQSSGRGRGSHLGHGAARFPARGNYTSSFRGGYRGNGGYGGFFNGHRSGVKRLDNRPRRIAVANIEPGSERDEALRQHLIVGFTMSHGEMAS
jgi:RNA recognition motif-containing protein